MSACIEGIGLVTPMGRDPRAVCDAVLVGTKPEPQLLRNPFRDHAFPVLHVDPAVVDDVARLPRSRRSGAISHFAVAAALDAMKLAQCKPGDPGMALVFATTNGGVVHTRRFFDDIATTGTHTGSPLLFPETVYNAPASHIAAALGITGIVTTLVNDATAGIDAIATACELMQGGACERCLVVVAEEVDWVVCEAAAAWGLTEKGATPMSEGAAALVLSKDGKGPRVAPFGTAAFRTIPEAKSWFSKLSMGKVDHLVSSASGRTFDEAEVGIVPDTPAVRPKFALGEAFAASAGMQVVLASMLTGKRERTLVTTTGFHGQQAAVLVENSAL